MASWGQTQEPNVKVIESVKRTTLQPASGENLIIGGVLISNTGELTPQLITSRSEFLNMYTPDGNITSEFIESLNKLNEDAGTIFLNTYRLLGSARMVICRASGLNGAQYMKEIGKGSEEYVMKDSEILKKIPEFKIKITDIDSDWYLNLRDIGIVGSGKLSDVPAKTLNALAEKLNETSIFHLTDPVEVNEDGTEATFTNAFVGSSILDITNSSIPEGLLNIEIDPSINEDFSVKNYILNMNATSGTLKVEFSKNQKDGSINIHLDTNTESVDYIIGPDADEGQITLEEFNEYVSDIQIVCPEGLENLEDIPEITEEDPTASLVVNVEIPEDSNMLIVSDRDYQKAWDALAEEERYVMEGLCDCGMNKTLHQNYIATTAVSMNCFYPISPVRSTNYMVISNHFAKITLDNMNLYQICPWDIDDGTVGFKFFASPAVLYWEAVFRNRAANNEFAAVLGEINGVVSPVSLAKEFNRKERQLLLTKRINTIFNDVALNTIYINDCYTKQSAKDIMQEENNVRLKIHISKSMPKLLSQFRGRQSNFRTWDDAATVVRTWFKSNILPKNYTIADYRVDCSEVENTPEIQAQNKLVIKIHVRYYNTAKYIEVYNIAFYHLQRIARFYSNVRLKFIELLENLRNLP